MGRWDGPPPTHTSPFRAGFDIELPRFPRYEKLRRTQRRAAIMSARVCTCVYVCAFNAGGNILARWTRLMLRAVRFSPVGFLVCRRCILMMTFDVQCIVHQLDSGPLVLCRATNFGSACLLGLAARPPRRPHAAVAANGAANSHGSVLP